MSPIIIKFKVIFQKICEGKGGWDDNVDKNIKNEWLDWIEEAKNVEIRLIRCYFPTLKIDSIQLHCFFDASEKAFATVIYIRTEYQGAANVSFVASKSRITSLKKMTIPRKELLGALLAAKLWFSVSNSLESYETLKAESFFWGDSKTALQWIINGDEVKYKQFVQNRIIQIRSITGEKPWNHVPGCENPADLPTRGISPKELNCSEIWSKGPKWLSEDEKFWPKLKLKAEEVIDHVDELKVTFRKNEALTLKIESENEAGIDQIIDEQKYSDYNKLIRISAYVNRFVNNAKKGTIKIKFDLKKCEITKAEEYWIKVLQLRLTKDKKFEKIKVQLRIFNENGFLRSKGRIDNSEFPIEVQKPRVLPGREYVTKLLIKEAHKRTYHGGVNDTMAEIRQRFWIPALRQVTRKIVHECMVCKKIEGKPFRSKPQPPLPDFRVKPSNPFSYCAIDFAGHYISENRKANGRLQ